MSAGALEVRVPDIGEFSEVAVIEVLVAPGDRVTKEQSLITIESDKASMEIPSPEAGVVTELVVHVGDRVSEGSPVLRLTVEPAGTATAPAVATTPVAVAAPLAPPVQPPAPATVSPVPVPVVLQPVPREPAEPVRSLPHASPSIRRFARELGVDLPRVVGSGPKGRILREDVQGFVKQALSVTPPPRATPANTGSLPFPLAAWPTIDFAKFGPIEARPLSRIRRLAGANLHRNWVSIPHVTQHDEADITDLEAFRREQAATTEPRGFKLTFLAFLLKASVTALRQFPEFNASLDPNGEQLILKRYFHLGVAVDTPDGLVVPVIRDVDRKGVFDLARELSDVSKLARDGKLKLGDLQGGTFSISSLGGIGGTAFTPIINAPEVAILGVSRATLRPVHRDGAFVPRLIVPLSLSYDHRVIDGAAAARFTSALAGVLSDIRRTLL